MKVISETTFSVPDEGYFKNDYMSTITVQVNNISALKCGTNQIYSDHVNGCQANCVNPESEKSCHLPYKRSYVNSEFLLLTDYALILPDALP
jgi:hypothetical protein